MSDHPELEWREGDVPFSPQFNDTYYSKSGGRDETSYVFLKGNGLPERAIDCEHFTIGELGFGTSLNFLETLRQLRAVEHSRRPKLTFISFELYPMNADQMEKALRQWPELSALWRELKSVWSPKQGWNTWELDGATLLLGVGDANVLLPELQGNVDAWYLDGFNPALNKALWGQELLNSLYSKTKEGGSFATYTAAGWVRRNLESAGFDVERIKGFGHKREMMRGTKKP
ncbi:tRNA (5-methylaminomethyl-2-thiouridine)(34)-methyltransferase MnmD [Flexibacterium corallicola]|uniref:tRNA (5-methylaminomethyl-2-thiouridine)(34)-methyltransferase MnmD n=1 Tax=Flexibacterium corallicola TaxID=3037259 RepID=UPI00286F17E8|nr:tRNA (5-methylaminomethyl-2-thiouridine)(34)-methyltransferase MnmD [Pseudovibrio sp. M1P-2-3]